MPKKIHIILALSIAPILTLAEPTYQLFSQPSRFRIDFQQISVPHNNAMSLVGLHYDAFVNHWLYGGLGAYTSVVGRHGGFSALGVEAGVSHTLFGPVTAEAGVFAGAGGGANTSVGSGSLIQPYVGVSYDFDPLKIGLAYHYFNFINGDIKASSLAVTVDYLFDLHYADSGYDGVTVDHTIDANFVGGTPYASNDSIAFVLGGSGINTNDTMNLAGFRYEHYFNQSGFGFLQTEGSFKGTTGGYQQILIGSGWSWPLIQGYLNLKPKIAVGAGGGGNVDTGGGFLIKPSIGLEFLITNRLAFQLDGGYIKAPQGRFKGVTASASLVYEMEMGSYNLLATNTALPEAYFQGWRIRLDNLTYFNAKRRDGNKKTLNLFTTELDLMLGKYAYLAGEVGAARSGGAAGYRTGLAGFGMTTSSKVGVYGQVLLGSGGGGTLDSHGGFIIEPAVGVYAHLNPMWSIHAAYGRVKSLHGSNGLNSNTMQLGISYRFSTLMGG